MSIIYEPHVCDTPPPNTRDPLRVPRFEFGTIWKCRECGKFWRYREQFVYYLGEWRRVRFWNLIAKHRIRKARR